VQGHAVLSLHGVSVAMTEALFRRSPGGRLRGVEALGALRCGDGVFPLIPGYAHGHVVLPGAIHAVVPGRLAAACDPRSGVMLQGG